MEPEQLSASLHFSKKKQSQGILSEIENLLLKCFEEKRPTTEVNSSHLPGRRKMETLGSF